ncbi:DNA cytosine methyltransferase [Caryophanon latum]|uniref:DNA (cytosine-5-)-methyltransferase n=1 Tax=Caryophanon latum TaxID=33977 RepID=A0A1C0YV80_9BACL|nr:DNA cytosine methyltransferase [Caryophanon latum]OCS91046.1 DNA (cytosine-5-)-methyltransferase [Caryophanon latum]
MEQNSSTRGRGKVKPLQNLSTEHIQAILLEKIEEETALIIDDPADELLLQHIQYKPKKYNMAGLFSGCGGLDLGFELAGLVTAIGEEAAFEAFQSKETYEALRHESVFHTIYTNDMFKEANETYKLNFPSHVIQHEKDIRKVANFPLCNVMLGGFPCPGFSEAGPRLLDDKRNFLYIHFIRALMQTKPEFFIAENVKGMMTLGKGEVVRQIVEDFASAGYNVKYELVNSRDYGVPQLRERVFLVGVRHDVDFDYVFPEPTHGDAPHLKPFVTLHDAIGDLQANPGPYYDDASFSSIYMSRNRKKSWDEQSFTIQASGRQAPMHPGGEPMIKVGKDDWQFQGTENRRLSVKEIARIQTFPDWYEFSSGAPTKNENGQLDKIYKQIGNAVPVLLARAIAQPIADYAARQIQQNELPAQLSFQSSLF